MTLPQQPHCSGAHGAGRGAQLCPCQTEAQQPPGPQMSCNPDVEIAHDQHKPLSTLIFALYHLRKPTPKPLSLLKPLRRLSH